MPPAQNRSTDPRDFQHLPQTIGAMTKLAEQAGLPDPALTARQLLLLKEGAIVTAHLGHTQNPARDAKAVALGLLNLAAH